MHLSVKSVKLYSQMRVVRLAQGEDLSVRDFANPDFVYVAQCDPETALRVEMTRYQGGEANQTTATVKLEQG